MKSWFWPRHTTGLSADLSQALNGVVTATVVYTDGSGATWPFVYTGSVTAPGPYTSYTTPAGIWLCPEPPAPRAR